MLKWLPDWYIAMRNARAWSTAVVLALALVWLLWETRVERIDAGDTSGVVEQVTGLQTPKGSASPVIDVRLADGKRVKLLLSAHAPLPKVGDRVPLHYEFYADGKRLYWFNDERWLIEGH